MEQNKDQSGAVRYGEFPAIDQVGFKLVSHTVTPGGPIMADVTDVYEKDGVKLTHLYGMGGESWTIGAAVRGEAVAKCTVPPIGWRCTRIAGHEGPCAAYPIDEAAEKYEAEMLEVIDQRDKYHDMADQLAAQIAAMTEVEIGEHSSNNEPWRNALIAGDEFIAAKFKAFCNGPVSARAAGSPSEQSKVVMLRQALVDLHHAIQFAHDSLGGGIHKMPTMLHHEGTVTEFIETVLAKSRAADALDSQPTVSAVLAELRADLRELANNTETFGEHSQEAARVAFDSATDALDEVAAKYASSQPTDGGVRNG